MIEHSEFTVFSCALHRSLVVSWRIWGCLAASTRFSLLLDFFNFFGNRICFSKQRMGHFIYAGATVGVILRRGAKCVCGTES